MRQSPALVEGIALILLADELGDAPRRGKMLDEFCNRFAAKWPRVVAIARLLRDANGDAKRRSTSRPSRGSSTGCPLAPAVIPSSSSAGTCSTGASASPRGRTSSKPPTRARRRPGSG